MQNVEPAMAYHHIAVMTLHLYITQTAGRSSDVKLLSNYLSASMIQNTKDSYCAVYGLSLQFYLTKTNSQKKDLKKKHFNTKNYKYVFNPDYIQHQLLA